MSEGHLTEKEIIEYQFKLASAEQMARMAKHLEDCSRCRQVNERLAAKLAALELLRKEPDISEQFAAKIIENVKSAVYKKTKTYRMPAWLSAAAVIARPTTKILAPSWIA